MKPICGLASRITFARPLRPPLYLPSTIKAQPFFIRSTRGIGTKSVPRPEIPYLSATRLSGTDSLASRPLTTEARNALRHRLRLYLYYATFVLILGVGGVASSAALKQDWLDRKYPSPEEWNFKTKLHWTEAHDLSAEDKDDSIFINWASVGSWYSKVLEYCEEALQQNEDWDDSIPGIDKDRIKRDPVTEVSKHSRLGKDISDKSEPWRRAYFEALMGYTRATEMNHGWVVDFTRKLSFPRNQMIGPSNPNPHPTWPGSPPAPLEENCEPNFDDPKEFYIRILTTKGFTPRQRLDAGLAYASWVEFTGNKDLASAIHHWTLDLARKALENEGTDPDRVVDSNGIIKSTAPFVTPNIIKASTAMASHLARSEDFSEALNIYTSVLRARRVAPDAPAESQYLTKGLDLSLSNYTSIVEYIMALPWRPKMPPPPTSGNEPFLRTRRANCEEAGVMAHVGEIMFASSSKRAGLSWTRDAVALAEKGYVDRKLDADSKRVCTECMSAGLDNWRSMLAVLAEEQKKRGDEKSDSNGKSSWSFWVPSFAKSELAELLDEGDWREEANQVEKKRALFQEHRLMSSIKRKPGLFM